MMEEEGVELEEEGEGLEVEVDAVEERGKGEREEVERMSSWKGGMVLPSCSFDLYDSYITSKANNSSALRSATICIQSTILKQVRKF